MRRWGALNGFNFGCAIFGFIYMWYFLNHDLFGIGYFLGVISVLNVTMGFYRKKRVLNEHRDKD